MSWPPSNQPAASPIWISPSLLLLADLSWHDSLLTLGNNACGAPPRTAEVIYTSISIHLFCWRAALLHLHGFISGNLLPSSPPQPPLKPLKPSSRMMRTEKVNLCSASQPSQHIATETQHAAHTYDYIAHESADKNAIECTLMSPCRICSNTTLRGWKPPREDDIKTLKWETAQFNALGFTLKDELKQFRGELSICWLALASTHCLQHQAASRREFIHGGAAAEDGCPELDQLRLCKGANAAEA